MCPRLPALPPDRSRTHQSICPDCRVPSCHHSPGQDTPLPFPGKEGPCLVLVVDQTTVLQRPRKKLAAFPALESSTFDGKQGHSPLTEALGTPVPPTQTFLMLPNPREYQQTHQLTLAFWPFFKVFILILRANGIL